MDLKTAISDRFVQYRKKPSTTRGFMGILTTGVISVPGKGNTVYVTLATGQVIEAFNNRVPLIFQQPVVVGRDDLLPGIDQVLSVWDVYTNNGSTTPALQTLSLHHTTHEWPGIDTVYVLGEQFVPGLFFPVSGSLSVEIWPAIYNLPSGWKKYASKTTLDLTSHIPSTSGHARCVLIVVDSSGAFAVRDGADNSGGYAALADADIPAPTTGDNCICAVKLFQGQADLKKDDKVNDFVDLRFAGADAGSTSLPTATEIGNLIHGSTEKTSLVDADRIGFSDSAASWILKYITWTNLKASLGSGLGWYNVKDYGATGDDTTNDYTAINSALAALKTAGAGVLYFPAHGSNKYRIGSTLMCQTASSKPKILIMADPGVEIRPTSDIAAFFFKQDDTGDFSSVGIQPTAIIENVTVNPVTVGQGIGVQQQDSYNVEIRNCKFNNLRVGIVIQSVNSWNEAWILDNITTDNCTTGIEFLKSGGTGSFQSGKAYKCFIRTASGGTGVKVGNGAILLGCDLDLQIWPVGNNSIGIDAGGDCNHSAWTGIVDLAGGTPTPTYALKIESTATNLTLWNFSMEFWGTYSGGEQESGAVKNASAISWVHTTYPFGSDLALSDTAPNDINTSNSPGTSIEISRSDHTHKGLRAISKYGSSALYGDITLSEGSNISITQTGNNLQISSSGSGTSELLMADGVTAPPVPIENEAQDDWLYSD